MESDSKIVERVLYEIWKNKNFSRELKTAEGENVTILDVGIENTDTSGPDFKGARLRIGNLTYVGDIEIDNDFRDWKAHGHHLDKKYNSVVLHLTIHNKNKLPFVFNKNGRKITSICLQEFIDKKVIEEFEESSEDTEKHQQYLRCVDQAHSVESKLKTDFVFSLGVERFKKKCEKVLFRLKELTYLRELNLKEPLIRYELNPDFMNKEFTSKDFNNREVWQQLFYEMVFEALGYSKNKTSMFNLAQAASIGFLKTAAPKEDSVKWILASLFHISGIIPEEKPDSDDYIKELHQKWSLIKDKYDGRVLNESQWHFFKLRPQNFPTIRIAGGAILLQKIIFEDLLAVVLKKFEEINNPNVLSRILKSMFIIKGEGYWKNHYMFGQPSNSDINYFIGGSRADEIIINVLLPYMNIYADIFSRPTVTKKILQIYANYVQIDNNNIVKFVSDSLVLDNSWKKSSLSQGMIELFRNYCSKNRCLECKIGETIFN